MDDLTNPPAVLGGAPAFEELCPIVSPQIPDVGELLGDLERALATRRLTNGPHRDAFEEEVAAALGVDHAIALSSCTSGLAICCRALELEGEVIIPSFTFMATAAAMVWAGLKPVFAEVRPETTNLAPEAVEAAISPRTSAIVAVHNFGAPAEIEALERIAERHGLALLFDAAHGFGSLYRGRPVGGFGRAESFSMSPTKLVIAAEGGFVTTNDPALAERVRAGREYGKFNGYDSIFAGLSARISEFNCILGRGSLKLLEEGVRQRNRVAALYRERLGALPGLSFQDVPEGDRCSYKDFSIVVDAAAFGIGRDALGAALKADGIDTRNYYDPPCHRMRAYAGYVEGLDAFPDTDHLSRNSISLPIWSCMDEETAERIAAAVCRIQAHAARIG